MAVVVLDALLAAFLVDHLVTFERLNPWHADALCREYPTLDWFPTRGDPVDEFGSICARCLVLHECRA